MEEWRKGRLPKEPPEELTRLNKNFPQEYIPLARQECAPLILRETVGRRKRYFCTHCDETYDLDGITRDTDEFTYALWTASHGTAAPCAKCGTIGDVIDGKRWNLDRHWCYRPFVVRVQLKEKRQALLCFDLARRLWYSKLYGFSQEIKASLDDIYLIDEGVAGHYKYYWHEGYCKFRYRDATGESFRGGFVEPFSMHTASTGRMSYTIHDVGKWDYSRDILRYVPTKIKDRCEALAAFACYPQLEMIYKAGFDDIVYKVIHGKKCARICNIEGQSFKEVFPKFEKAEIKSFKTGDERSVHQMETYLKVKKVYGGDIRYLNEVSNFITRHFWGENEVFRYLTSTPFMPHLAIRYFEKLMKAFGDNAPEWAHDFGYKRANETRIYNHWRDYIQAAKAIGFDLSREDVVFPKDLGKRHDIAVKLHRNILAEKQAEELKELWAKNEQMYGFSDGEFVIVNPKSTYDIIDEGKVQGHCVASYADRHAQGTLAIVFIRKVGEEDKAFLTVEMRKEKMWQVQGKSNRYKINAHEQEFIDKWLAVVNERFNPKKTKRKEKTAVAVGANA